ncbi:Transmembrane amino acid transporter [Blattamonas nauphoetae]|uniref:Transmembrane amino acid transporter n=1 Tax=Blattamonas nauphoetae TaxID=2049346 RepID=A0ABQ9YLT0_9EUKA|nr:Transmembrane amino acid transporter [Blattamonas nauphoetae]
MEATDTEYVASSAVEAKIEAPKKEKYAKFPVAVISLVNSTLGAGMLGIPLAYAKAGLVPALLMHVMMGLLSWASFYFLTYSAEATGCYTYGDLAEKIFGVGGTIAVEVCNFSYTFGPLWSYLIMIGQFIPSLLRSLGVPEGNFFLQYWFIVFLFGFVIVQPLSWFRTLDSLKYTSVIGMFSMIFVVICLIIRYCSPYESLNVKVEKGGLEAVHPSPSIIQTFSTLCFAFGCQQNVPIIHGEIKEKSTKRMNIITVFSVTIVGVFYMLAGIFGYMTFTSNLLSDEYAGNITTMFSDKDGLMIAARICSLITVMFCCPMNSLPARIALFNVMKAIRTIYRNHKAKKAGMAVEEMQRQKDLDRSPSNQPLLASQSPAMPQFTPQPNADEAGEGATADGQNTTVSFAPHPGSTEAPEANEEGERDEASEDADVARATRRTVESTYDSPPSTPHPEAHEEARGTDNWRQKKCLCCTYRTIAYCIVGSIMVYLAIILAIFLDKVNFVFDLLGSTAGVGVAFLIPGGMYLRVIKNPTRFVNVNRDPNTTRPEGLEEFRERNEKMLVRADGCTCGVFWAWVCIIAGCVFGLFSLAMAIIFDTNLQNYVNW